MIVAETNAAVAEITMEEQIFRKEGRQKAEEIDSKIILHTNFL